jgi:hypothetical protein
VYIDDFLHTHTHQLTLEGFRTQVCRLPALQFLFRIWPHGGADGQCGRPVDAASDPVADSPRSPGHAHFSAGAVAARAGARLQSAGPAARERIFSADPKSERLSSGGQIKAFADKSVSPDSSGSSGINYCL